MISGGNIATDFRSGWPSDDHYIGFKIALAHPQISGIREAVATSCNSPAGTELTPQRHCEIRQGGEAVNPAGWLGRASAG